jgi:hypothetical protein
MVIVFAMIRGVIDPVVIVRIVGLGDLRCTIFILSGCIFVKKIDVVVGVDIRLRRVIDK